MKLNNIDEVSNSATALLCDVFGLLSSRNFAIMATWRNDFSPLLTGMAISMATWDWVGVVLNCILGLFWGANIIELLKGTTRGIAWEKGRHFVTPPLVSVSHEKRAKNFRWCFITFIWVVLLILLVVNLLHPIRRTTQIRVVTRHQYGISALVSQTSFRRETSGGVANCRLFSQAARSRQLKMR